MEKDNSLRMLRWHARATARRERLWTAWALIPCAAMILLVWIEPIAHGVTACQIEQLAQCPGETL